MLKRLFGRLIVLVLVATIGLTGCSGSSPAGLVGNYREDTLAVVTKLQQAIELPSDSPDAPAVRDSARKAINDFASFYRKDPSLAKLASFTTMQTALNSLAAHYTAYPNRPIPDKLKERLDKEFKQVEAAIKRGA
jgi:photosystem II Psb27 protein